MSASPPGASSGLSNVVAGGGAVGGGHRVGAEGVWRGIRNVGTPDVTARLELSRPMQSTLKNVGLHLTEQRLFLHVRTIEPPKFMVLMPGLARGCHSSLLMRHTFRGCHEGAHALTFVLQFPKNDSKTPKTPFDMLDQNSCMRSIAAANSVSQPSRCNVVLVRQSFRVVARPCGNRKGLPNRVEMQTIAVGRAWEWARHAFPGESKFYIRARLDDVGWCLPAHLPDPKLTSFIAFNNVFRSSFSFNNYYNSSKGGAGHLGVSDRWAVVPAEIAQFYFEAWRIWSERVTCSHNCFAAQDAAAVKAHVKAHPKRNRPARGECPISEWVGKFEGRFRVYRVGRGNRAGNRLMRHLNSSHVRIGWGPIKRLEAPVSYSTAMEQREKLVQGAGACKIVAVASK